MIKKNFRVELTKNGLVVIFTRKHRTGRTENHDFQIIYERMAAQLATFQDNRIREMLNDNRTNR